MSNPIFKQFDARWGAKNYNGSSTISMAACGPFSVTNVLNSDESNYVKPIDVVKFMQKNGYAVRNHGTAWSGIPAALKHFSCKDVKAIDVGTTMKNVWAHMEKGYDAVFLFSAGKRGGVCWTTQGHYVAATDYDYKNKKHYLYMEDSGGRNNDGWFCYETTMKGLIPKVWVGQVKTIKPHKKTLYKGTFPKLPERGYFMQGDCSAQVGYWQDFLTWALDYEVKKDNDYGTATKWATMDFQRMVGLYPDGNAGKKTLKKAEKFKN